MCSVCEEQEALQADPHVLWVYSKKFIAFPNVAFEAQCSAYAVKQVV